MASIVRQVGGIDGAAIRIPMPHAKDDKRAFEYLA
jgi:hypothetical protein